MKDFESWALKIIDRYHTKLLLTDHTFSFTCAELDHTAVFDHVTVFPYKATNIRYGQIALDRWNEGSKDSLKVDLIHEVCHSLTDPLYHVAELRFATEEQLRCANEQLNDHLANIFFKLKL